jgi:hypothetical protein
MVVHETMRESPDAFAEALARFLGRPLSLSGAGTGEDGNIRNTGGRTWRLRRFDRHAAGRSGSTAAGLARAGLDRFGRRAEESIELTAGLSARILEAYRPANTRLARSLGTDLGRFGYV